MEVNIGVYGMTCSHCQKRVEDAVSLLEGVGAVRVNLEAELATVSFNPQKISMDDIKEAIRKAGYSTDVEEGTKKAQANIEARTLTAASLTGKASETVDIALEELEGKFQACPLATHECRLAEKEKLSTSSQKTDKKEITLGVSGMTCSACALNIEKVLKKREGVDSVAVNLELGRAKVSFDPSLISPKGIEETIESIGYKVETDRVTLDSSGYDLCILCCKH